MPRTPRAPMHGFGFSTWFNDWNGLEVQELTRQLAEFLEVPEGRGLLVTEVEKGSVGEKAGFKAGDVITKLDGSTIRDVGDLADVVKDAKKDSEVPCDIFRKGKTVSLKWHVTRDEWDDEDEWDEDDDDTSLNYYYAPGDATGCHDVGQVRNLTYERLKALVQTRLHEVKSFIAEKISGLVEAVTKG